ncbi:MAG: TetR/AcrR family transcriptional regulator [Mogibacterium sp.]|nr:TetR/AcrR family transcriptional regulator [Mogibacterium sp.]
MGKIEQNKKQKRTSLLFSAYELFTTIGFDKTTIRDIASRAGVAKGTFYLYFDDKYSLRDQLIRHIASQLLISACASMEEYAAQQAEPITVPDKFVYIIDYLIDRADENRPILKLINKDLSWCLFTDDIYAAAPGRIDEPGSIDFVSYILNMLEADHVEIRDLRLLMFTLIDMINSTVYDAVLFGEPVGIEEYKPYLNRCIRLLVNDAIEE